MSQIKIYGLRTHLDPIKQNLSDVIHSCVMDALDYPADKLITLAKEVKTVVDDKAKYTDWSQRADIKAELKVDLIILLAKNGYPPVDRDEVYKEIFEQAESFKKYQVAR